MIRTYVFIQPGIIIEVNMENDDTATGQSGIPVFLLAVLHHVELVLIGVVADEIGNGLVAEGRHVRDRCLFTELSKWEPSHEPAFVGRIATGYIAFAVIVAIVHQVPLLYV